MSRKKAVIKCGTINPNTLKIAGKPNRAMTPEVKLAPVWTDRKNDYRRHKEKQKIRRYSDDYGNGGFFSCFTWTSYDEGLENNWQLLYIFRSLNIENQFCFLYN